MVTDGIDITDINAMVAATAFVLEHWGTFTRLTYHDFPEHHGEMTLEEFQRRSKARKPEMKVAYDKLTEMQRALVLDALDTGLRDLVDKLMDGSETHDQETGNSFAHGSSEGAQEARKGAKGTCAKAQFRHAATGSPFATTIRSLRDALDESEEWVRVYE
jgi:hypothetical protein